MVTDVVLDAIGGADQLTLTSYCRFVKFQQKDLDAATLLAFRVYSPDSGTATYEYKRAGELWERDFGRRMPPGTKFAQAETVSSSATFVQIEYS